MISKYQIEIPIIQRDYAQGRNNVKAADVRKSLVKKMIAAVDNNGKDLFFDFVYGRVDDNKFIPFDGQQRLTTLFLFHKYIFEKCQSVSECSHTDKCICKELLGRFSYATRQSSREFCEKLVENNVIPGQDEEKLSEHIKDQSWFYSDWEKDPTVMGMLTMLDEIHNQMREKENFKSIAEKLTSGCNCPITFHYVDMGEHKLSDETYVKMNARGKQLTPFENFKASLEQNLEEKSKSEGLSPELQETYEKLLARLKGEYDESSQRYKGIDGTWLNLFWKVANKDKEDKELPDNIMLSFFNRHFMNVWQCWYAKDKGRDEDEKKKLVEFNSIIQKELPLYPSKDDFIPFEIYRYVMDNCGVENCLSPIFNIWDALCKEGNNIPTDCQAVWNRKENKEKWDLYQKEKNESYKSHAAFYALLMYYKEIKEIEKPTLSQWMRVAWNIIENYVEGEDSYINTLVLIDTIANKNFRINELKQDEYKVAKDQVTEEIEKAKQILNGAPRTDGKTWEDIIIDAEKYAFFKGAIRFLFQNKKGELDLNESKTWNVENFNKKIENAKKYFSPNGVCEEYDEGCVLLRTLISYFSNWENFTDLLYVNSKENWRDKILLNKNFKEQVNTLLSSGEMCDFEKFESIIDDAKMKSIQNQLVKTDLLENLKGECYYLEKNKSRLHIYRTNHNNDIYLGDSMHENRILASLIDENRIDCNQRIKETNFFRGEHINFLYKIKNIHIQWYAYPNKNELDVYLMENEWADYKKKQEPVNSELPDNENYYCFSVSPEMIKNPHLFMKKLDCLIAQAYPDSDKSICAECQEKICKSTSE